MKKDKRIVDMRSVYAVMDEDKRQKMELLAISLLNVQTIVDNKRPAIKKKHNQRTA
jgi:hypothetical protein